MKLKTARPGLRFIALQKEGKEGMGKNKKTMFN